MGRYSSEQDSESNEDLQHTVSIGYDFYMGKYELTKEQWTAIMGTTPWSGQSYVLNDPKSPAVYISWNNAQSFMAALNTHLTNTGQGAYMARLPSESEWEYACRSEKTTRFYWDDDPSYTQIGDFASYYGNAWNINEKYAHIVGQKLPNSWGLYDMSGNVWEWCQDWYHSSYNGTEPTDGSAWETPAGSYRVGRGGDFGSYARHCRSAYRRYDTPSNNASGLGFRVCLQIGGN